MPTSANEGQKPVDSTFFFSAETTSTSSTQTWFPTKLWVTCKGQQTWDVEGPTWKNRCKSAIFSKRGTLNQNKIAIIDRCTCWPSGKVCWCLDQNKGSWGTIADRAPRARHVSIAASFGSYLSRSCTEISTHVQYIHLSTMSMISTIVCICLQRLPCQICFLFICVSSGAVVLILFRPFRPSIQQYNIHMFSTFFFQKWCWQPQTHRRSIAMQCLLIAEYCGCEHRIPFRLRLRYMIMARFSRIMRQICVGFRVLGCQNLQTCVCIKHCETENCSQSIPSTKLMVPRGFLTVPPWNVVEHSVGRWSHHDAIRWT